MRLHFLQIPAGIAANRSLTTREPRSRRERATDDEVKLQESQKQQKEST
jgi:hypothetical protein